MEAKSNSLSNYVSNQENQISEMQFTLSSLQQQLQDLQQQLRVSQQLLQAQKSGEKELANWKKQTEKLFKDLCSIFPKEALEDIKQEFIVLVDEIKESHEEHAASGRFLNGSEDSDTEEEFGLLPSFEMEDGVIDPVLEILNQYPEDIVFAVRDEYGINGKTKHYKSIALRLTEMAIPLDELEEAISDIRRKLERQKTRQIKHTKQLTLVG